MSKYAEKWSSRPETVDCWVCGGDGLDRMRERDVGGDYEDKEVRPDECCSYTGLDQIPWSELFIVGRLRWNGGGL